MLTADSEQETVWRDYYLGVQSLFYLAQGVAMGSLLYLTAFIGYLNVDDFGRIIFQAVIWLPWYLKVFFGVLSDNVPILFNVGLIAIGAITIAAFEGLIGSYLLSWQLAWVFLLIALIPGFYLTRTHREEEIEDEEETLTECA